MKDAVGEWTALLHGYLGQALQLAERGEFSSAAQVFSEYDVALRRYLSLARDAEFVHLQGVHDEHQRAIGRMLELREQMQSAVSTLRSNRRGMDAYQVSVP